MIEGENIDKRAEPKQLGTLRHRCKENSRRCGHAEGREMMLGNVIAEKPETLVGLRDLNAFFEKLLKRSSRTVNVIEDAKFHIQFPSRFPFSPSPGHGGP